jgi:hypothetical protein
MDLMLRNTSGAPTSLSVFFESSAIADCSIRLRKFPYFFRTEIN